LLTLIEDVIVAFVFFKLKRLYYEREVIIDFLQLFPVEFLRLDEFVLYSLLSLVYCSSQLF